MCHRGLWFRVKVSQWSYGSAILKPCGNASIFFTRWDLFTQQAFIAMHWCEFMHSGGSWVCQ
jgi:hypothetical protein